MIHHISRFTTGTKVLIQVYYTNGKIYRYTENDNLPNTVLKVLLNGICETKYTATGKVEYFKEA